MEENNLSYLIRGAVFRVNKNLGPGLLESIYVKALCYELTKLNLEYETEVPVEIIYDGQNLGCGFRLDILVNNCVVIEAKSVEEINPVHHKQMLTYLKITGKKLGLLINFNVEDITDGIIRKVNGLGKQQTKSANTSA